MNSQAKTTAKNRQPYHAPQTTTTTMEPTTLLAFSTHNEYSDQPPMAKPIQADLDTFLTDSIIQ